MGNIKAGTKVIYSGETYTVHSEDRYGNLRLTDKDGKMSGFHPVVEAVKIIAEGTAPE